MYLLLLYTVHVNAKNPIDVVGALKGLDNIRKGEKNRARSYKDLGRKLDLKGDKYIDGLESLIEQANKID